MELADLSWPAVAALAEDATLIVFPIAACTEQHGRHMPVFTDSLLLGEVVRRVKLAAAVAVRGACSRPLQWPRQLAPPLRPPRHACRRTLAVYLDTAQGPRERLS